MYTHKDQFKYLHFITFIKLECQNKCANKYNYPTLKGQVNKINLLQQIILFC